MTEPPLLAYQMIEIVDKLSLAAHTLIEPIAENFDYSEIVRRQARLLVERADLLADQTSNFPEFNSLYVGVNQLRSEVERFLQTVAVQK